MPELLTPGQFGTEAQATSVQKVMAAHNKRGRRPLTPFEAKQLSDGEENPVYIYNTSPIHRWSRPQGQLGTIVISPRKWDAVVSDPAIVKGAVVRWYKSGLGAEQPFIEGGLEIAQDVCGMTGGPSTEVTHLNTNLERYGVFLSAKPFEAEHLPESKRRRLAQADKDAGRKLLEEYLVPKLEQKRLISEAQQHLIVDLQSRILEADNWHMGGIEQRKFIGAWHRDCLKAFNYITGKKESRPWASIILDDALEACIFCGNMNKQGLPKCPNCHEIINQAAYERLKEEIATAPTGKK